MTDAGLLPLLRETMMAQGEPSSMPNYHLARSKQPRHRRSPGGGGLPTGASEAWVSLCGGDDLHAAIVLQRHGHAMGRRWATAKIPAGCDLGATPEAG